MYKSLSLENSYTIFQKIKEMDYILIFSILSLGIISGITMYSTDGGQFLFHTKSHITKFLFFFPTMIILSFINIKIWHSISYIFYIVIFIFLIWVSLFGIKASGSQRWVDLYLINLQPSELMKIAIIACLSKYYHRMQVDKVNTFCWLNKHISNKLV